MNVLNLYDNLGVVLLLKGIGLRKDIDPILSKIKRKEKHQSHPPKRTDKKSAPQAGTKSPQAVPAETKEIMIINSNY